MRVRGVFDVPKLATLCVLFSCFILSFIAGSLVLLPQDSKAVTGLSLASAPTISLGSTKNTLEIQVTPTPEGKLASDFHTLHTTTNVPTGYSMSISADNSGASSGLTPTAGTISSPIALQNNTWGFALASAGAVGVVNDFNASYATPFPDSTSKWANPSTNAVIKKTNTIATNDSTTVYYGVKTDVTLASGTYANAVRYTAVANIADIKAPVITSITPNSGTTAGGTQIAIVGSGFTASYVSVGAGFYVNDKSVTTAVTIDGVACTDISISSNTPTTGKDTIYCSTPPPIRLAQLT